MNHELSTIIKDTDEFAVKVHEYFSKDGLDFKIFVKILDGYRNIKCNPEENMIGHKVLILT